jgi:phage terminase small subunit
MPYPATPTALKLLAGNPGHRPLNQNEPKPELVAPTCPSHLSREAKREWRRIVPELEKLGLLTRIDRAALAAYATAYGR